MATTTEPTQIKAARVMADTNQSEHAKLPAQASN